MRVVTLFAIFIFICSGCAAVKPKDSYIPIPGVRGCSGSMREFSYECEIGFENDGRKSLVTKEYLHSKKIAEFHISLPHGASEVGVDRRDRYINIIYTLTWGGNKGYKYFERWRLITDPGMNAFVRGGLVGVAVDHLTYGHGAYFKLIEEWSCSPEGKWTKLYPMGKGYDYTHPRKMIAPVQAD